MGLQLSKKHNAPFLLALKTAHKMKVPPTVYLRPVGRYSRNSIEWDDLAREWDPVPGDTAHRTWLDSLLEQAYMFYKDAHCGNCGTPMWYGYSEHPEVAFEIEVHTCYGCEAMERDREAHPPGHGQRTQPKPAGLSYESTGLKYDLPSPEEAMRHVP